MWDTELSDSRGIQLTCIAVWISTLSVLYSQPEDLGLHFIVFAIEPRALCMPEASIYHSTRSSAQPLNSYSKWNLKSSMAVLFQKEWKPKYLTFLNAYMS